MIKPKQKYAVGLYIQDKLFKILDIVVIKLILYLWN